MSFITGFEHCVRAQEPLAAHTWFRMGGPAEYFAEPTTRDELLLLVKRAKAAGMPVRVLGGGSNVLVGQAGVKGVVLHLGAPCFGQIEVRGKTIVAGAGAKLGHIVSSAVRDGLAGLESLVGIPGTLGGALRGNSGNRSGDVGQWTASATVINDAGEVIVRRRDELVFSYRESNLDDLLILEAEFELEREDPVELTKRMQKQWIVKRAALPLGHQPSGCIFRNPRGLSAGDLIEQAGMKGLRYGGAEISDRHANFIVADDKATPEDVLHLIEDVRNRVKERLGVDLETELRVW